MRIKLTKCILALIAFTFVLTGCSNNDELASVATKKTDVGYVVKDGYLSFVSNDAFVRTVAAISNLSNAEREKWENAIGFVSQRRLINELIDKELSLDSVNRIKFAHISTSQATKFDYHPELYYQLLSKGIIKLIDEGTPDEYWDYSEFNRGFSAFINEDGLYAVGDSLFQVTNKELKIIKLSSASNKQDLLKALNNGKCQVSKMNKISASSPGNSPGLIESTGNNGSWTQNNRWPSVSQRIKLGIELSCLAYSLQTARFDFTHNYYVTCQKTNFWNSWINESVYNNVEGAWTIEIYYYTQSYSYQSFNYSGTSTAGIIQPETGERMYAGTTFWILPNAANQTYDYVYQQAYQPKFSYYKWRATRTDTGQQAIVKSYSGDY